MYHLTEGARKIALCVYILDGKFPAFYHILIAVWGYTGFNISALPHQHLQSPM